MNERGWRVSRDELAEGDENLDGSCRGRPHRALIEVGLALVEKGRGAVAPSFGLGDVLEAGADLEQRKLLARVTSTASAMRESRSATRRCAKVMELPTSNPSRDPA